MANQRTARYTKKKLLTMTSEDETILRELTQALVKNFVEQNPRSLPHQCPSTLTLIRGIIRQTATEFKKLKTLAKKNKFLKDITEA